MSQSRLPYGRQDINYDDIDAVCRVLESDLITQGPVVGRFESTIAQYCGAVHAVAVNSATSALHIACMALDIGPGDSVWTTPNTFVASANCALYCGADIDFVDIDAITYNMCPRTLAIKLKHARQHRLPLPRAVIVVHFAGQPCDMKIFSALAKEFDFKLIEDASHAVGARYRQEPVGDCRYSDITVFSFHPVKIITSGEGGMALTNSDDLAERLRLCRSHGVCRPEPGHASLGGEPWVYEQIQLGFNYRLTDIHAALGLSQLKRLDEFVARRHEIADIYRQQLSDLPFIQPVQASHSQSALHLYPIMVPDDDNRELARLTLYQFLVQRNIAVNVHYIPVHTQPYYRRMGFRTGDYPVAENYYQRTISLPIFGSMSADDQGRVVDALREYCTQASTRLAA